MGKLTASQIANILGKSVYTIKRWYSWYESLTEDEIIRLAKEKQMPVLPKYETIGATQWRYWLEDDIPKLKEFANWVPHTRGGVMGKLNKKEEK